jgi:hypothetical protein
MAEIDTNELVALLARHAVAFSVEFGKPEDLNPTDGVVLSGFIIEVRGVWLLVTAGHIIEDINTRLRDGWVIKQGHLYDGWAKGAVHRGELDFPHIRNPDKTQFHIYDDLGRDYAVILLRDYYKNLLQANGVVPLSAAAWDNIPWGEIQRFAVYGFKDSEITPLKESGNFEGYEFRPAIINYEPVKDVPEELKKNLPRLFFAPPKDESGQAINLKGMSGGPVFGFTRQTDGQWRVWLVGVQSHQAELSRLAIVCPMEEFIRAVQAGMDDMVEEINRAGQESTPAEPAEGSK